MSKSELIVGLDIGTTKICCVVGETSDDGTMNIVGVGESPSTGLRKGVVVNIEQTVQSIRKAVEEAERMANCEIGSVYAGIAGSHIKGTNSHGAIPLKDGKEVDARDIERVIEAAKAVSIPSGSEVIHILPQEYIVDDQLGISDPVGMSGYRLEAHVHIVTGAITSAQNIVRSCKRSNLEVSDIVLEALASSKAILTDEEREIDQFPEEFEYRLNPRDENHPFGGFWMAKNHLLLVPQLGNQMLEIDRDTLERSVYEMNWKDHIREPQEGIFDNLWGNINNTVFTDWDSFIHQDYNEIAFVTSADGCMLKLNIDTHQYTEIQIGYDYAELKERFTIEELYEKFEISVKSREDRYHTLADFIDAMTAGRIQRFNTQQRKVYSEYAANLDGTCGEKVHKAVKKSLQ